MLGSAILSLAYMVIQLLITTAQGRVTIPSPTSWYRCCPTWVSCWWQGISREADFLRESS